MKGARQQRHNVVFWDQDGRKYRHVWRQNEQASLASLPQSNRLVDVHDPADHLVAVLVDVDGVSVLYERGDNVIRPSRALMPDGFAPLMVTLDEGTARAFDVVEPSFKLYCDRCRAQYLLEADKMRVQKSGRRVPRLRL